MKRWAAFIFLGIYLISFSELSQFLKVPVLVQHFVEHRSQNSSITFWDFIKEHYNGKFEIDEDYDRDSQLPFRNADCVSSYTMVVFLEAPYSPEFSKSKIISRRNFILKDDNRQNLVAFFDIFQPPRTAVL